ncbi:MAG: thioredoxin fold domain-containing protein [Deltaproteobacteria bacterium]|nr:thioredoxin fold domain-containing protein [Deltaproteobacteria bacterium]
MKPKLKWVLIAAGLLLLFLGSYSRIPTQLISSLTGNGSDPQSAVAPTMGRVTMIDLGATECIPCKMMAPMIEELRREYAGKADILFIDVWKNPGEARKYGIRAIPTQIFFTANGKEVHRNVGFMDKERIVRMLSTLGVS